MKNSILVALLLLAGSARAQVSGGSPPATTAATLASLGAAASGANGDITSMTGLTSMKVGAAGVSFSSGPVFQACGPIIVGSLASGTTFMAFTPDAAITLIRITGTVEVAGIGGSGDTVKCNNAAGTGLSVVMSAAAVAGTTGTSTGSSAIAYQGAVSCHIDSGAATRPIMNVCLEYILQ